VTRSRGRSGEGGFVSKRSFFLNGVFIRSTSHECMSGEVAIVTALGAQDNIITTFSPFSCFKYGQDMLVKITILGNNLSIFLFMPCIINIFLPLSWFEYVTMHLVQSRRENTCICYRRARWQVYAMGGWKERAPSCTETGKGTRHT